MSKYLILLILVVFASDSCNVSHQLEIGDCIVSKLNDQIQPFIIEITGETETDYELTAYYYGSGALLKTYFSNKKDIQKLFRPIECPKVFL